MFKTKRWVNTMISLCALAWLVPAMAYEAIIPDPPSLSADEYILIDFHTGSILAEKNADVPQDPASLTKMMSAYVIYSALESGLISMNDEVSISVKANAAIGSRTFLKEHTKVPLKDVLLGMVVQSGNDATIALAEHIAGSEESFVDLMNEAAKKNGLNNSFFMNSTGLTDTNHKMTARDAAKLAQLIIKNYPGYYGNYSVKEFFYNGINQPNRNRLLHRNVGVDGIKTGYTEAAGYCFTASAVRNGMRLISVTLGSSSPKKRAEDATRLLNYGFRFFKTYRVYEGMQALQQIRVWKGQNKHTNLGVAKDFYITTSRTARGNIPIETILYKDVIAPVEQGQKLGEIKINLKNSFTYSADLIALDAVAEGSFMERTWDGFLKMIGE
ncbi:MAG: D-alanyl-D-alanine carboxypeptidase family protein [Candidatus Oxydemutatoraceae bacterium WSBS_2016_MAG_OTU14]